MLGPRAELAARGRMSSSFCFELFVLLLKLADLTPAMRRE